MSHSAPNRTNRRRAVSALALVGALALSGCGLPGSGPSEADTLHVLAGSEVRDMEPILEEMARETGVHIEFEYMGTLDGTESLLDLGDDAPWDATWFPSNSYFSLFPEGDQLVRTETSIMRSPVVLGVKADKAAGVGWTGGTQPTWAEVVDEIDAGRLTYGMTSPISSNSGFTTLVQAATALSGTGTVLESADIAAVTEPLTEFAHGQELTSGSSGWLADRFIETPDAVDAIFNYESVLAQISVEGQPLQVVIPSDGVVTSDYPFTLLRAASDEKAELYQTAVEYLMRDEVQQQIADQTFRRTNVSAADAQIQTFELPFPARLETVQQLLEVWLSEVRKPASMVFAIDTSGSMADGTRMSDLRDSIRVLSGQQASGSEGFLRLKPRERIVLIEFAEAEKSRLEVDVPSDDAGVRRAMDQINERIDTYQPVGGTEIYGTVADALEAAAAEADPARISSVVLFSDGEDTGVVGPDEFQRWYEDRAARDEVFASIPVFAIVFADADFEEMEHLAELTGGRAFDVGSDSLVSVFREIRGYL